MDIYAILREHFSSLSVERDFSFARNTTIGVGGKASAAAYPCNAEQTAEVISFLTRKGIPHCFLGAGANVLPSDGDFDGVVVRFSRLNALYADGSLVYAGAGVTGGQLCRFARGLDLSGFEPFTGIPMTVGGGVTMNAGVVEGHFSDLTERVLTVEKGKIRTFSWKDCDFSEKYSVFQSGIAVIGVYLRGKYSFPDTVSQRTCYFRLKRKHLPKERSMGCVFVNPANGSAGKTIDECGLKGLSVGGARVSEAHANFIVNGGGATSVEIARLIQTVKSRVKEKTGIELREEIKRIPPQGVKE